MTSQREKEVPAWVEKRKASPWWLKITQFIDGGQRLRAAEPLVSVKVKLGVGVWDVEFFYSLEGRTRQAEEVIDWG
jgi:hypothetical protein